MFYQRDSTDGVLGIRNYMDSFAQKGTQVYSIHLFFYLSLVYTTKVCTSIMPIFQTAVCYYIVSCPHYIAILIQQVAPSYLVKLCV